MLDQAIRAEVPEGELLTGYVLIAVSVTKDDTYNYTLLSPPNQPPHAALGLVHEAIAMIREGSQL